MLRQLPPNGVASQSHPKTCAAWTRGRQHPQGSSDGHLGAARVRGIDPLTGRYRTVSRTIEGGRRDADRALAELLVEVGRGGHTGASVTFGELLDSWLDLVADRLSPTTLDHYRAYATRYLKPALGTKPVRQITSRDLDRLYLAMSREKGLKPRTIRQAHSVVRGALGQAVKWDWLAMNPALMACRRRSASTRSTRRRRTL